MSSITNTNPTQGVRAVILLHACIFSPLSLKSDMALLVPLLNSVEEKLPDCYALEEVEAYIGRHPSCKVQAQSPSISRMHARVFLNNGQWMVEDLRSLNGVAVNGKRVYYGPLNVGDILQVGRLFFTLANASLPEFPALKDWLIRLENQARFFEQQSELFPV